MEDLAETLTSLEHAPTASHSSAVRLLRGLRQQRVARADLVLRFGPPLLRKSSAVALGDEFWVLHEQVALAALDLHDTEVAEKHIAVLVARFGEESQRVKKLLGMREELSGNYSAAQKLYDEVLEANASNLLVRKRKVAVLRAQGQLAAAAAELNATLDIFQGDAGCWQELCDLHEKMGHLEAAAFCLEELVLLAPASHVYHCRLAEVYAALRTPRLTDARKHLAQALSIAPKYARALHALATVCVAIAAQTSAHPRAGGAEDTEVNTAMWEFARDELRSLYETSPMRSAVAALLTRQEEAFSSGQA